MHKGYIYKWENMINGKVYIGQTMNRLGYKERWSQHKYQAENNFHNNKFHNAIRKYGINSFRKTILDEFQSDNKANLKRILDDKEIGYINKYNSYEKGYNSTVGGDFNIFNSGSKKYSHKHNQETIKRIVEKSKLTKARKQIYNSVKIKTKINGHPIEIGYGMDRLLELYKYWDIDINCKYRYEHISKIHWKQNMDKKYYGRISLGNNMNIYSLDFVNSDELEVAYDNCDINVDELDYDMFDKKHVRELIFCDLNKDNMSIITKIDMDRYIKSSKLSKDQFEILRMRRAGLTQQEIADSLMVSKSAISKHFNKITDKIIKVYEKGYSEDYYYISIVKGNYKKCSMCNNNKLIKEFHKHGNGRFHSQCKECRKQKR